MLYCVPHTMRVTEAIPLPRNLGILMRNGLLEQEQDALGAGRRTGNCWNATIPATLVSEVTCRGYGIYGYFKTHHQDLPSVVPTFANI